MLRFILYIYSIVFWFFWWINAVVVISIGIIISFALPKSFRNPIGKIITLILTYSAFIFPKHTGLKPKDLPFPVIFTPNHVSIFDLFISGAMLPGYPRGLQLERFFSIPIYGWLINYFGMVPIKPGSYKSVKNSFKILVDKLKYHERNILIMPEGFRTPDGRVNEFKSGAFLLSKKTGVPVVPVVYKGLFRLNNRMSILARPGRIQIKILEPVYPQQFSNEDEMASYVRGLIVKELED